MKSFKLIFLCLSLTLAFNLSFSSEFYNGCSYDTLTLVNPFTGFLITDVNCGLEVDKEAFYEQPYVFYNDAVDDMKYTLFMLDKDNEMAFEENLYLHWLVTDIDGRSLKYGLGINPDNTAAGKNLFSHKIISDSHIYFPAYVPPDPSEATCVHHYSIYIYEQRFHPLEFPLPESRNDFDPFKFIENIVPEGGISGPVASIEFKSRY